MPDLRAFAIAPMLLLVGCLDADVSPNAVAPADLLNLRLLEKGAELRVPVPVVLVGFPPDVAPALARVAEDHAIKSNLYLNSYSFALGKQPGTVDPKGPYTLIANFTVHEAPAAFADAFYQAAESHVLSSGAPVIYDAYPIEDWIAANLALHGLPLSNNTPTLLLIHGGDRLASSHAYRVTLPNGYLEPVRVFGERHPVLAFDVSAIADPYIVGPAGTRGHDYDQPIAKPTAKDAPLLYELAMHAAYFRLLQGPLYPPSLKTCHGVTLIQAYEVTSPADLVPGVRKSQALIDKEGLHRAFSKLMAPGAVHLDVKTMVLPRDDPVLHAMLRQSQPGVRWHVDANWDKFWVPHAGCEAYVSFLWHPLNSGGGGQALYSMQDHRRFSISSTNEVSRAQAEMNGMGPSTKKWDLVNMLYAHETGHLFGLRHPHDITNPGGPTNRPTFSSIWSTMSYQQNTRISEFGAVETNNLHRNRAGLLLVETQKTGLDRGPAFEAGVQALSAYDWVGAARAFEGLLAAAPPAKMAAATDLFHWDEHLPEDWTR